MKVPASLFIVAPNWKQPRCPTMGDWLNKPWYTHTIDSTQQQKGVNY